MAGVRSTMTTASTRRALGFSLALALALTAVPLQRLSAAAHDPARAGAGMGTRAPLMFEAGARLAAPGLASAGLRAPVLPRTAAHPRLGPDRRATLVAGIAGGVETALLLALYGRRQLEGG